MKNPVDVATGQRLMVTRKELGMSQTDVGNACGISFQQIQKYESGINRVSMSRLFQICGAMGVKPSSMVFEIEGDVR